MTLHGDRDRPTRSWITRIALAAATMAAVAGIAQPAVAATSKRPLAVVAKDFKFLGAPAILSAGTYDVRFFNIGHDEHVLIAVNLGPTCSHKIKTVAQAKTLLDAAGSAGGDPEQAFEELCPGGSFEGEVDAGPG